MVGARPVFVISNDVVPGQGMPVAAPGLRAFGLAEGLRANGVKAKTLVGRGLPDRQWRRLGRATPHPTAPHTEVVDPRHLARYLKAHAPAVAVMINSNQVDHLRPVEGVRYVLDFFAPKMLEGLYQLGDEYPAKELARLRERKIRAIKLADAFIVNGEKKVPYFLAWMLQAGRDVRHLPLEVVNMGVPLYRPEEDAGTAEDPAAEGPVADGSVRFAIAGYLQSWSALGEWVGVLERRLDHPAVSLDLLVPRHWGNPDAPYGSEDDLNRLAGHGSVSMHGPMNFAAFRRFLASASVAIDLFRHNLEREYAMVTRTVVALACGVPVVHPPFTEVSPMISRYDAGWLVEPRDTQRLGRVLDEIVGSPEVVREKTANARRLAADLVDPAVAVRPLLKILEDL